MTDEQKYSELLKELGSILTQKNRTLYIQEYQIKSLREKLEAAEQLISENGIKRAEVIHLD